MRHVLLTTCCLLAVLAATARAATTPHLRCRGNSCDFVLDGGLREEGNLLLQPNAHDPRTGRLKLNGFVELFPDWRPPETSKLDRLLTWAPTARLVDGSSVRLFDIAPNLTVGDSTGSAIFSVTGTLTRTGARNPLYQWTGFFSGTRFKSAASAICVAGPNAGKPCASDDGCAGSMCEGGSPLYQDAFFDGSVAEQTRGHAIQRTWIPISFLSKATLVASRTCGGGTNDGTPCRSNEQCTGGGACEGAYLDQDKTFALYAQPSFQEYEGATLISRDYAAVAIANPGVSGSPQIDRFTGMLCDPYGSEWSNLPAGTERYCISSLGASIKSRHAGPVRIGDTVTPHDALEVNGAITLDTGGDGTINGSRTPGSALRLNANASIDAPGPLRIGVAASSVSDAGWTMLLRDEPLQLASPHARVAFSAVAGSWTVSADAGDVGPDQGFDASRVTPTVAGTDTTASRTTGVYRQALFSPTFVAGGADRAFELRVSAIEGLRVQPGLSRENGSTATVEVEHSSAIVDAPRAQAGTRIGERRGVAFLDNEGGGTQGSAVALDVADQSTAGYAAAVRSAMQKGEGKWNLALTGSANSVIAGAVALGAQDGMVPEARLHVRETVPGAEVVRIDGGPTNAPSLRVFQQRVRTSGADAATLHTFTPEPGRSYLVEARVVARCADGSGCTGESAAYVRRTLLRQRAGGLGCVSQQGGGADFVAEEIESWDAKFDCSGSELRLIVQGDAQRSVSWQDTLVVQALIP